MEQEIHTDIFIAGAGAAGIAAAVAAADAGLKVHLAERNSFPGGRATASAVGTICGLYLRDDDAPRFAMKGFPKLFAEKMMEVSGVHPAKFAEGLWFLPAHPDEFEKTARAFLANEKINLCYDTTVESVEYSIDKITSVICSREGRKIKFIPHCVIDCSGEGFVCSAVNHQVIRDEEYQAAAIVFAMKNVSASDEFSLGFSLMKQITMQIENGKVPSWFNLLSIVPSSLKQQAVMMKMGLPWKASDHSSNDLEFKARALVKELVAFMIANVAGFENAGLNWIAKETGVRTGLRAMGKKVLTDDDVLSCRQNDDGICNGAWPVEYWRTGNKRVEMTYFEKNNFYSIPAGCLVSPEKTNLFFGGKIISAEEKAIASARVIGTCFGTGYAAGMLAAGKLKNESETKTITEIRKKLQL